MDRNTVIGFVLIGLVLMIWMYMNAPPPPQHTQGADSARVIAATPGMDTARAVPEPQRADNGKTDAPPQDQNGDTDSLGRFFASAATGERKTMAIETPLYRTEVTTVGGGISKWELKNFFSWNRYPAAYFDPSESSVFNMLFYTADGKRINTRKLYFSTRYRRNSSVVLEEGDSLEVAFRMEVAPGSAIVRKLLFRGNSYLVDESYEFVNMERIISNFQYNVIWEGGLRYFEQNSVDESNYANSAAYAGGELKEVDAGTVGEPQSERISGRVTWTAIRNKYFVVALLPRMKESQGAFLEGNRASAPDQGVIESYTVGLEMPFAGSRREEDRISLYLGPLEYDRVRALNVELDRIMSLGAVWVIRPISQYFIIPTFQFLHWFIPNYGIVLIIFAFLIKVILYPLTKKSMESMQKMQALQPMMTEIREKHKEDPQVMNKQMMRLYKEYGVNPAGGCLPLVLQLPILYALWSVFGSTIDLRQAHFMLWMQDLATPDVVVHLPFKLPLFGIDKLSGLAMAMGVTMFIQQKMSVKDPRQKMMVWMMPLMMTLLFNSFPSGLNLYYFVFNLLSILQQSYINKKHKGDPLRKVDEKKRSGGFIAKFSANLPQQARKK